MHHALSVFRGYTEVHWIIQEAHCHTMSTTMDEDDILLDEGEDEAVSVQLETDDYLLEEDRFSNASSSRLTITPSPAPPSLPTGTPPPSSSTVGNPRMIKLVPSPLLTKPASKKTRRKKRAKALKKEDKEGAIHPKAIVSQRVIQLKKDNQRKVKNQLVLDKARVVETSSADINNVETNPSKRMRFHGKKNWNKNLLLSPNPNWKSREHSKFGHVMVSPHFRYQPKKPNNAPLNYQPHPSRDHSSHDHQSHDMRRNVSSASNFPTHFTRNYNNEQSHDPVSRDLVSRDPVHSVTNATHSEESHDYWSHDKVQNIVTILSSLKRKLEQSRGTSRNSFPLNYQPLQSHDQSHDQSCDMGRADFPNPMPIISKHDQSSDHNSSMMTVYEDGSKKFWDKGITLLDYGEPAARAGSIGSNVINDMKTPLVRGGEEMHPCINHQQNNPAVSLELPHPSAPSATIFTDFCDSPSPFPPPPRSNIFTIRPNQVKTSIAPFSAAPPLFSITPMTKVTKPSTESPLKLFTVPQTITSSHGLAHNNPPPAATAKSSEKSTTNRYSVSQSRYSGAFSNSASKYMAPKVSVGSPLIKPLQANKQGQQFKGTTLVPFSNNPAKTEGTMAVSNPLLANRHNATNPTIMSSPSPAITLTASGTVTPLFYRSQKKEGMSVNSSTSCFTINRLATTQTQFKLSHL